MGIRSLIIKISASNPLSLATASILGQPPSVGQVYVGSRVNFGMSPTVQELIKAGKLSLSAIFFILVGIIYCTPMLETVMDDGLTGFHDLAFLDGRELR